MTTKALRVKRNAKDPDILIAPHNVERFLLEVCGGGWTAAQTAKAMTAKARLENGETVRIKPYTLSLEETR